MSSIYESLHKDTRMFVCVLQSADQHGGSDV